MTGLALVVLTAGSSHAQEPRRIGATIALPAGVGILWNLNDRVALWPELTAVQHRSSSTESASSESSQIGIAARALFYLGHDDRFRPYVSPRFAYGRQRSTSELESPTGRPAAGPDTTSSSYAFAGSLGAVYVVGTRVGLFGDAGVEYISQQSSGTVGALGVGDADTVGMRTSVGVIIYF